MVMEHVCVSAPEPSARKPLVQLTVLGGNLLHVAGVERSTVGKKEIALLTYLACTHPAAQSRNKLITLLWGERFEKQARQSLRHALMSLRKALGFDPFIATADALSIKSQELECDVFAFKANAGSRSATCLDKAAELYKGPLLEGLMIEEEAWTEWLACERQRLEGLALDVLLRRGNQLLESGQALEAYEFAQRAINIDPYREDANRLAMLSVTTAGRGTDALRQYSAFRNLLAKELNTKPDHETTLLYQAIRDGTCAIVHPSASKIAAEAMSSNPSQSDTVRRGKSDGPYNRRWRAQPAPVELPIKSGPDVVTFPGNLRRHRLSGLQLRAPVSPPTVPRVTPTRCAPNQSRSWRDHSAPEEHGNASRSLQTECLGFEENTAAEQAIKYVALTAHSPETLNDVSGAVYNAASQQFTSEERSRLGPVSSARLGALPTIAIIPFCSRTSSSVESAVGHLLADEIIATICRSPDLAAISRLSTQAFSSSEIDFSEIAERLGANYVIWGAQHQSGDQIHINMELVNVSTRAIVWNDTTRIDAGSVHEDYRVAVDSAVSGMRAAMLTHEVARYQSHPLESLENYSLLMSAIALMHRTSRSGLDQADRLLRILSERLPRHPLPLAWRAQLHLFRTTLGRSGNLKLDQQMALDFAQRATDLDPDCSIALAAEAWVNLHVRKRFDVASDRLGDALHSNRSESTAWLLKGSMHAFKGEGTEAVASSKHARRLSPLDPRRSYFECLAATANLSAGRYDESVVLARKSLRANRLHASTWRVLIIGLVQSGRLSEARLAVPELMRLHPSFTVNDYIEQHPACEFPIGASWAKALSQAGVP